jgi:hypothetical protein
VLDGAATFVTGGTAQNVKADNPLQPRAQIFRAASRIIW